jgi:hypothetical protein
MTKNQMDQILKRISRKLKQEQKQVKVFYGNSSPSIQIEIKTINAKLRLSYRPLKLDVVIVYKWKLYNGKWRETRNDRKGILKGAKYRSIKNARL